MRLNQSSWTWSRIGLVALLTAAALIIANIQPADAQTSLHKGKPAKYILFFIGDGLGLPQRMAAEKYIDTKLAVDLLPGQGITTTHAADRFITGSAASATALGSGTKTNIGMIGMTPDQRRVKSVAHLAKEKGMKVGIVSSVSIDHATPAAFYAHVKKRSQYYDIDVALAESGFDFFGGGGIKDPTNKKGNATEFKGDARELIQKAGYKIVNQKEAFMALTPNDGKVFAYNDHLPDGGALPYAMDMQSSDISLPEFTAKAIEMLDNPNGFFLMVEGGKIDWACHANDAAASIHNTLSFDKAVREGIAFAQKHPEDTLLVVSGDHECGGLTLGWAGTSYDTHFELLNRQNISFQKFSDEVLKPFKAKCGGNCTFDAVKPLITQHFGLKFDGDPKADPMVLKPYHAAQLQAAFNRSIGGEKDTSKDPKTKLLYGGYDPLTIAITHTLNNMAGLGWTSFKHTGVPVSTSAMGVGAKTFNGYYDNIDVAKKIMAIMGVDAKVHFAAGPSDMRMAANN
jgi:alkaline phosphatase